MLKQWLQKQERLATRPPLWYRAVSVLLVPVVILGALVLDHTAIGWIAGIFIGSILLLQAIKPGAAAGWDGIIRVWMVRFLACPCSSDSLYSRRSRCGSAQSSVWSA